MIITEPEIIDSPRELISIKAEDNTLWKDTIGKEVLQSIGSVHKTLENVLEKISKMINQTKLVIIILHLVLKTRLLSHLTSQVTSMHSENIAQ